ncbi:hypothetical protein QTP88_012374 [Uroleucon formosanum]
MKIENVVNYPVKFLNSLNFSGFLPHLFTLKICCPIMLLRNLIRQKLCSGTPRLAISDFQKNLIEAKILTRQTFKNATSFASYTSPNVQNEIITICGDLIQENILKNIRNAKCFSILVDETQDVSRLEQMSFCVRYVDGVSNCIMEDFLEFSIVHDMIGKGLSTSILQQGYDGAASMSGQFSGVQQYIREAVPHALYVHCTSHYLKNLAVGSSCKIVSIRNCIRTVSSVIKFSRVSSQRTKILIECINEYVPQSLTKILIKMYLHKAIYYALKKLEESLQKVNIDLSYCYERVTDVCQIFKEIRENGDDEFKQIFSNSEVYYYKRSIFLPFLDHFICQFQDKFTDHHHAQLQSLIPNFLKNTTDIKDFQEVALFYKDILPNYKTFGTEIKIWLAKWKNVSNSDRPTTSLTTLSTIGTTPGRLSISAFIRFSICIPSLKMLHFRDRSLYTVLVWAHRSFWCKKSIFQFLALRSLCLATPQFSEIKNRRRGMLSRGIVSIHDNARSHTSNVTKQLLADFAWEQFNHPPYSPDLTPRIQKLVPRYDKRLNYSGNYVEK